MISEFHKPTAPRGGRERTGTGERACSPAWIARENDKSGELKAHTTSLVVRLSSFLITSLTASELSSDKTRQGAYYHHAVE